MTSKKNIWLSSPYIIWIIGFILIPIFTIVYYAFTDNTKKFTFSNIIGAVTDTANLKALGITVLLATLATLICLFLAYPLAICLTKLNIKNKSFLIYLFILPIFMNFMLQMVAINVILEDNGIINSIMNIKCCSIIVSNSASSNIRFISNNQRRGYRVDSNTCAFVVIANSGYNL